MGSVGGQLTRGSAFCRNPTARGKKPCGLKWLHESSGSKGQNKKIFAGAIEFLQPQVLQDCGIQ